jgi:TonB family protein
MLKRASQLFLVSSLVLSLCFIASAQGNKTQPQNSTSTTTNTANTSSQQTTPDREQDGFLGPVRRAKTEVAKLSNKAGKFIEGTRTVLENVAYDMKGVKSEYSYFPNAVGTVDPTGRETYKYDEKGNISEMTVFNADGSLAKKELYTYEYDFLGNWIKMTTSVAVIEGGRLSYEPTEATYRTISYYMDENVLKQMEAAQKNAATNAVNANASSTSPPIQSNPQPSQSNTQTNTQPTESANKSTASNTNHAATNTPSPNTSGNNESKPANTSSSVEKKPTDSSPKTDNANNKTDSSNNKNNNAGSAADTTPSNTEPAKVAPKILKPISGGVLNGKAVNLPMPEYPDFAKRSRISGVVSVEVVIDENGKIISAKAISGPGMLQQASVNAALRAKFSPTTLSGQAVKVTGVINYNFSMN